MAFIHRGNIHKIKIVKKNNYIIFPFLSNAKSIENIRHIYNKWDFYVSENESIKEIEDYLGNSYVWSTQDEFKSIYEFLTKIDGNKMKKEIIRIISEKYRRVK